jgi:hypothetical protein
VEVFNVLARRNRRNLASERRQIPKTEK